MQMLVCACCCKQQNNPENGRDKFVVVQLDVKKAFDHVDHRVAFKARQLDYKV